MEEASLELFQEHLLDFLKTTDYPLARTKEICLKTIKN